MDYRTERDDFFPENGGTICTEGLKTALVHIAHIDHVENGATERLSTENTALRRNRFAPLATPLQIGFADLR